MELRRRMKTRGQTKKNDINTVEKQIRKLNISKKRSTSKLKKPVESRKAPRRINNKNKKEKGKKKAVSDEEGEDEVENENIIEDAMEEDNIENENDNNTKTSKKSKAITEEFSDNENINDDIDLNLIPELSEEHVLKSIYNMSNGDQENLINEILNSELDDVDEEEEEEIEDEEEEDEIEEEEEEEDVDDDNDEDYYESDVSVDDEGIKNKKSKQPTQQQHQKSLSSSRKKINGEDTEIQTEKKNNKKKEKEKTNKIINNNKSKEKEPQNEKGNNNENNKEPQNNKLNNKDNNNKNDKEMEDEEDSDNDDLGTEMPYQVGQWLSEANMSIGGPMVNSQYSKEFWIDEDELDQDQEDDLKDLEEEMEDDGRKKRRRKRSGKDSKLSDENGKLLGKANVAYSNQNYQEAIQYLHEIIQSAPNANQAWFLLAIIHEELGEQLKALQFYLVAAHITKKDGTLWKRLGLMAKNLNQIDEAIYCYSKAIHADNKDFDAIWDRSFLYYEQGNMKKAIHGYLNILKFCPNNIHVIKELSKIYLKTNNIEKAIDLFENAIKANDEEQKLYKSIQEESKTENTIVNDNANEGLNDNLNLMPPSQLNPLFEDDDDDDDEDMNNEEEKKIESTIGYEEINMLAELYMEINKYEKAIDVIRKRSRIIQGRQVPLTENPNDDSEFDEDDNTPEELRLPMELRVRLGICRLYLNQLDMAVHHFYYLYKYEVQDYPELYFDVGEAYIERKLYTKALAIFNVMEECEQTDVPITWTKLAHCYQELGNLDAAVELLKQVLQYMPDDQDTKLTLAEVYGDMGEEEKALQLINEVDEASSKITNEEQEKVEQEKMSIFVERKTTKVAEPENETAKIRDNKVYFQKCILLYPRHEKDEEARNEFINTAFKLVQRFQNTKAFYPSNRAKKFTGLNNQRRRMYSQNIPQDVSSQDNEKALPNSFQGLSFNEWFDVIVKYAIVLAKRGSENEAQEVLWNTAKANVYYHNEQKARCLRFYMLGIALYCKNYIKAYEICRWFINVYPNDFDSYRFYMSSFSSGSDVVSAYASANNQKFFLRQIKHIVKTAEQNGKEMKNPLIYVIYSHILQCARSYLPALANYNKAFKLAPEDPIINFSLGLVHIHRAMQRQTDNRHLQIIQGFSFFFRYYKFMKGNQEACYNIGRAFHQIGILYLAVKYYKMALKKPSKKEEEINQRKKEKEQKKNDDVIKMNDDETYDDYQSYLKENDDDTDLRPEVAYNLSLIYITSGSYGLAQQVLRKYCTF